MIRNAEQVNSKQIAVQGILCLLQIVQHYGASEKKSDTRPSPAEVAGGAVHVLHTIRPISWPYL